MGDKRFEQRMSDSDALMWSIEKDPMLRSTITAVTVLDGPPDHDRIRARLEQGTRMIARLRQRPISSPFAIAPPRWMVDPNFDLDYHVRFVRAPGEGSLRDLLDMTAPLTMQGFDRARPLWELIVVDGLDGGRAGLIQKIHHCVTDGVGGVEIALMLLDTEREPAGPAPALPEAPTAEPYDPIRLIIENLAHERRRMLGIAKRTAMGLPSVLTDPIGSGRRANDIVRSALRLASPAFEPLSPLLRKRSLSCRFDTMSASLADLKAAAKRAGGRLNDAFLAAVAGGFRRYHEHHGVACAAVRLSMPISLRAKGSESLGGNQFAPVRFAMPIGIEDPVERMHMVAALVALQRAEPALAFTDSLSGLFNRLPTTLVTSVFGGMLKGIDCTVSNVPGLPFECFLGGSRIEAQHAMGPLAGAAVNLTLLSYVDSVYVGVVTDPAAVADPEVFVACLEEGFAEVLKS